MLIITNPTTLNQIFYVITLRLSEVIFKIILDTEDNCQGDLPVGLG